MESRIHICTACGEQEFIDRMVHRQGCTGGATVSLSDPHLPHKLPRPLLRDRITRQTERVHMAARNMRRQEMERLTALRRVYRERFPGDCLW
jgi:hypothetical protein